MECAFSSANQTGEGKSGSAPEESDGLLNNAQDVRSPAMAATEGHSEQMVAELGSGAAHHSSGHSFVC